MLPAKTKFENKFIQRSGSCRRSRPQWAQYTVYIVDEFPGEQLHLLGPNFQQLPNCHGSIVSMCGIDAKGVFRKDQIWVAYP